MIELKDECNQKAIFLAKHFNENFENYKENASSVIPNDAPLSFVESKS
tara:strand:+ start:876 stop:1019 length:144 start_codon:yes stop_codon:yes gene_type:complete